MIPANLWSTALLWTLVTIAFYIVAKTLYNRAPRWWLSPILAAPVALGVVVLLLHIRASDYSDGTRLLVIMMGPATAAFAIPIYEQRAIIRQHWPVLLAGVLVGSLTSGLLAWGMATVLDIPDDLRLSLLPRSLSTPFAMAISGTLGGLPGLTAVFVVFTGAFGAAIGDLILAWLPLRSGMARGALLGMSAHAIGTAKAHKIGQEEGAIAGLVMVLAGVLNVLAAPFLAYALK